MVHARVADPASQSMHEQSDFISSHQRPHSLPLTHPSPLHYLGMSRKFALTCSCVKVLSHLGQKLVGLHLLVTFVVIATLWFRFSLAIDTQIVESEGERV